MRAVEFQAAFQFSHIDMKSGFEDKLQMQYGHIPGLEKPVSRLIQGTTMINGNQLRASLRLLDDVFELGCTCFDTAHVYGDGEAERTFGNWVQQRGVREKIVIIGKGGHPKNGRNRVTPADISSDLSESLSRLKTDYIDLYLLHRDDPEVPVGPLIETLNRHLSEGRIKAMGCSNWAHERIQEAHNYAMAHHLHPFVVSSPHFSLAEQIAAPWPGCVSICGAQGEAARMWYKLNQMPIFAWSSLAGGFFSGRFTRHNLKSFKNYFDKVCAETYGSESNFRRLEGASRLAKQKRVSPVQIALAYVLNQPMNVFAIVGSSQGKHFKSNLEAGMINLSKDELNMLELKHIY